MKIVTYSIIQLLLFNTYFSFSQETGNDSSSMKSITLDEVVISVNKEEEARRTVAQQVQVLTYREINFSQAQTTADLLSNEAGVFVQKSQQGGGSPVIRGFEASRILLVVDGIRMNNIIYRAGHLQNIITLDNNILDRVEVLNGPASTVYGSDALGGVIHLYTKSPVLATGDRKSNTGINAFMRYGSVNNEITGHADINLASEKFGSLTSITFSDFGNLRGGKSANPFFRDPYGERPYYAERINGKDSLVNNPNRFSQVQSGYMQYDILQKFLYRPSQNISHGLNIQFSNSSDVPRYDRLTDPAGSGLKYAEWYYGPQKRLLTAYNINIKSSFFDHIHGGLSYQSIEESRHTRGFGKDNLTHRYENVDVMGAIIDFQKNILKHSIRFGLDAQFNNLESTANSENILTGEISPLDTRYPPGENKMLQASLYYSHTWTITDHWTLNDGIRLGYSYLHSTFTDKSFYDFPYSEVTQVNPVYSGNIGIINSPSDDLKFSLLLSSGYRVPNVDDLSKVFESAPGTVIVPNPDLKPEKTLNLEAGVTKIFNKTTRWETYAYYTSFIDAIVTDNFLFNGQDSIMYDGSLSKVMANQNKQNAFLYGISTDIRSRISNNFMGSFMLNYTYGRILTDSSNYPLDHIPPLLIRLQLNYTCKKFNSGFFINYNSWKKIKNYYLNGEDNEQYATSEGMPAWFTLNFHAGYELNRMLTLQAGIDNILDTQYRTFASGINGPGRNIFLTLRFHYR